MFNDPLLVVLGLNVLAVAVVLVLGIGRFGKGGEGSGIASNRLMQWRIGLQAFAVVLIMLYLWLGR